MAELDLGTVLDPKKLLAFAGLDGPKRQRFVRVVRGIVSGGVALCFSRSQAPDGTPYPPLKHRKGRPLLLTGALRTGATNGAKMVVDWPVVKYVVDTFYASFHQEGTKTVPARPFLGFSPQVTEQVVDAIMDAVVPEQPR